MEGNEAPLPLEPGDYMSPSLSSRGDRLAIAFAEEGGSHDIWTVDLAAGRGSRLTTDGENSSPLWVDDDRAIVFWSERNGVRTLYRRAADGSGEDEPVLAGPHGRPYSTTPDGRWITTNHRSDIWLVPTHPELEPRPLLETAFLEGNAAFSPDGEWYAYGSDEAGIGREDVYLRRADGSGGRITVTSEGGEDMVWSADGRTLYYRTADRVRAVDVELGPRPRVGSARTLFSDHYVRSTARNSDLSPDGRRFIMISEVESARLRFVENWFAELERLTSGD
jgi:Tol biopolymer transport system component